MTFPVPNFPPHTIADAKKHAVECFPKESCGLIVGGEYIPCENTAAEPEKDFRIDSQHIISAGAELQAVLHSHPQPLASIPTAADMQGQLDTACIWGIIPCNANEAYEPIFWGDFLLEEEYGTNGKPRPLDANGKRREPLIGREFIPGVSDCYTLIRAWYWQNRQIRLPECARDDEWWKKKGDLYRQNIEVGGFRKITMQEAQPGDVVLGQVRSAIPNHGGVLLEKSLLIHHLQGRLSCRAPVGLYMKHITHWLRYEGQHE
jgi:proteasome lid subunit RPN8/RPN11